LHDCEQRVVRHSVKLRAKYDTVRAQSNLSADGTRYQLGITCQNLDADTTRSERRNRFSCRWVRRIQECHKPSQGQVAFVRGGETRLLGANTSVRNSQHVTALIAQI